MKYRAILKGVSNLERPMQCFGLTVESFYDWATAVLRDYPEGRVIIFKIEEIAVESLELHSDRLIKTILDVP